MAGEPVVKIRKQDAGQLCAAGASWIELRDGYAVAGSVIGCTGLVALVIAIVSAGDSYAQRSGAATGTLVVAALLMVVGAMLAATMRRKRRSVVFQADGAIAAPNGLPGFESWRAVEGDHAAIISIESRQYRGTYSVVLVSQEGDQAWVSQHLSQDRALKVTVQLTRALAELRLAAATPPSQPLHLVA